MEERSVMPMEITFMDNKLVGAAPRQQCFATAGGSTIFCIV